MKIARFSEGLRVFVGISSRMSRSGGFFSECHVDVTKMYNERFIVTIGGMVPPSWQVVCRDVCSVFMFILPGMVDSPLRFSMPACG